MEPHPGLPHVLAGAYAADRRVVARPASGPRWFEPAHVRDPAHVREELARQAAAGADFVLAPTWLTHRRALVPVGESRRVREWTQDAVDLARQAAEIGRERHDSPHMARVLGVLPDPAATTDEATGKVPRPDSATERDERDQAGILAECGVAGVLIECRPSLMRARGAVRAVVESDLSAWMILPATPGDGRPFDAWVEELEEDGVAMLLLRVEPDDAGGWTAATARSDALAEARFGIVTPTPLRVPDPRGVADAWFAGGAQVVGIEVGATPDALRPLVEARDALLHAVHEQQAATRAATDTFVVAAARRAPTGRALWIGDRPGILPTGFDWTVVPADAVGSVPADAWRLIVSLAPLGPDAAARLLERGGIVAATTPDPEGLPSRARAAGLRVDDLVRSDRGPGARYIARRED